MYPLVRNTISLRLVLPGLDRTSPKSSSLIPGLSTGAGEYYVPLQFVRTTNIIGAIQFIFDIKLKHV